MAAPNPLVPIVRRTTTADHDNYPSRTVTIATMRTSHTSYQEYFHEQAKDKVPEPHALHSDNSLEIGTPYATEKRCSRGSSPFMRLPTEIRLQIYSLLLLPCNPDNLIPAYDKLASSTQDYFDYERSCRGIDQPATAELSNPTIRLRTIDPTRYRGKIHLRSGYSVRADRFNARCMETTYHCVNNPFFNHNTSILRVNRQIHTETAEMLYGTYVFDFDSHIEAIVPFLSDLTHFSRSCINGIRIVKRALPYIKEFDKFEWHYALRYLTTPVNDIRLRKLELGIVAGRPGEDGWDDVPRFSADHFQALIVRSEAMEWMQCLLDIRDLEELDVEAVVEHCPPCTTSSAMARFVQFSASIDTGFAEFLKSQMLRKTAG